MKPTGSGSEIVDQRVRRLTHGLTLFMRWVSRHWLFLTNVSLSLYGGLPALAPVLMAAGYPRAAGVIYLIFRPFCHQLPERSFFLFGRQWVYSLEELGRLLGGSVPLRYNGAPGIGFKVAVCERDVAIYLAMLLTGLAFVWLRRRLKPLPIKAFVALCVPMGVDGLGQLFGLWTSTWWSRLITGSVFGLACVWLAYPYLEQGMREVNQEMSIALRDWK